MTAKQGWGRAIVALLSAAGLATWTGSYSSRSVAEDVTPPATTGIQPARLYQAHCASCHGDTGKGDGPAAYLVFPQPRDFTAGVFRFKSTPADQPPTRDDLRRVISGGIERAAMPAFEGVFSEEQLEALIDYVLSLGPERDQAQPLTPIIIPPRPTFTPELIAQGKWLYEAAGCVACHGQSGQGDGPSAATLTDALGYPRPPADFTAGVFKSGRQPEDLYRTIMVGVTDTPMPAHEGALAKLEAPPEVSPDQVAPKADRGWAIVAYVQSLISAPPTDQLRLGVRGGAVIQASVVDDPAMLADPRHAGWDKQTPTVVSIQPLWQRAKAPRRVEARAARHGDYLAIHLEWLDATLDTGTYSVESFPDAGGVMFGMGDSIPALSMGQGQSDGQGGVRPAELVNIWQWRADRQLNAEHQRLHDVDEPRDGSPVDVYPFKQGQPVVGPISEHDKTFVPAWGVDNPKADPALMGLAVLESNAAGFGSLTLQQADRQDVTGRGVWFDGRWRVVLVRKLSTGDADDVDLSGVSGARRVPVALAVWDGSAGDRNGTKGISGWHWLNLGD